MSIKIQVAMPDEASQIATVLFDSFAEYETLYTPEGFAATTPTAENIKSRFNEGTTWVAFDDEMMVGTVSVIPKGLSLYIRSMAVLPKARGKKIGELLLSEIESFAIEHSYKTLILSTTPFLHRAIRLYESFGFVRNNEGPLDLFLTPLFTMTKKMP